MLKFHQHYYDEIPMDKKSDSDGIRPCLFRSKKQADMLWYIM